MGTVKSRRAFLLFSGSIAAGAALAAIPAVVSSAGTGDDKAKKFGMNPAENLMREHGVLRRVLLIYEEAINRINGAKELPPDVVAGSAGIIRRFVEDYHGKLEEDEIFPRLKQAGKLDNLVAVLSVQHKVGRRLTDSILKLSEPEAIKTANEREDMPPAMQQLYGGKPLFRRKGASVKYDVSLAMQQFIHMYRPHAAVEDTVVFPVLPSVMSPGEFDELGEKFEARGKELFGAQGFEKIVESVGDIEKKLGLHDLSKFTPDV